MSGPYIGACFCGDIRYELRGEPLTFYVCHCTDCQARCGGPALPVMWVHRHDLHIVAGEPIIRVLDLERDGGVDGKCVVDVILSFGENRQVELAWPR